MINSLTTLRFNCNSLFVKISGLILTIILCSVAIQSQGCLPSKHIPLNAEKNGPSYLVDGQWEVGISYRFLCSNTFFVGTEQLHQYKEQGLNARMHHHTSNLYIRYGINQRLSNSANVPIINARESDIHFDQMRHLHKTGTQIGDVRVVANYWFKDPYTLTKGNVSIEFGFKLSRENEESDGTFITDNGPQIREYDIALQPVGGGLGLIVEGNWFHSKSDRFSTYAGAHFGVNPCKTNGSLAQWFVLGDPFTSDSSDQFNLRGGAKVAFGQFAICLGARFDGIPLHDLIDKSYGFRRPGHILYLDNGIVWSNIVNRFSLSSPIAIRRNLITSNLDKSFGIETLG